MRSLRERRRTQCAREPQLDAAAGGLRLDDALQLFRFIERGMPDSQLIGALRQTRSSPRAVAAGAAEERRVGDDDVSQHVVVNIAAQGDDARPVEYDRWIGLAAIQRKLEPARTRK